jgi:hypothetical protein
MANDLILKSLEIRQFRGIGELRVGRLGRVNLIVGKNNVGKTTLLEALRLFARPGSLDELLEILASRNEIQTTEIEDWNREQNFPLPVDNLFYGRRAALGEASPIVIGPLSDTENSLRITLEAKTNHHRAANADTVEIDENGEILEPEKIKYVYLLEKKKGLSFHFGQAARFFTIDEPLLSVVSSDPGSGSRYLGRTEGDAALFRAIPYFLVGPNGLDPVVVGHLWDNIALSASEQDVVAALRIISPDIDRVALREPEDRAKKKPSNRGPRARLPYVKLASIDAPIPLRTLGDGVVRMFGLALALVNARGGFLLVDEIENGVHYSVQADLWRLVFRIAPRLNVQVFATTHSFDCIKSFEEAARESEEEGVLIRLAQKSGRTLVGEFDERELGIAVEGQIEVR